RFKGRQLAAFGGLWRPLNTSLVFPAALPSAGAVGRRDTDAVTRTQWTHRGRRGHDHPEGAGHAGGVGAAQEVHAAVVRVVAVGTDQHPAALEIAVGPGERGVPGGDRSDYRTGREGRYHHRTRGL